MFIQLVKSPQKLASFLALDVFLNSLALFLHFCDHRVYSTPSNIFHAERFSFCLNRRVWDKHEKFILQRKASERLNNWKKHKYFSSFQLNINNIYWFGEQQKKNNSQKSRFLQFSFRRFFREKSLLNEKKNEMK